MTDRLYVNEVDKLSYGSLLRYGITVNQTLAAPSVDGDISTALLGFDSSPSLNQAPKIWCTSSGGELTFTESGVYSISVCASLDNVSGTTEAGAHLNLYGATPQTLILQAVHLRLPAKGGNYTVPANLIALSGCFYIQKGQRLGVNILNWRDAVLTIGTDSFITIQRVM
jgi:hypothetical protein